MIEKEDISKAIRGLRQTAGYKNWKIQFDDYVYTVPRCSHPLRWFLLYDVKNKAFCIGSEFTATFNQIVLREAVIPSIKSTTTDMIQFLDL